MSLLRRLKPAAEPLKTAVRIDEDEFDRRHTLGDPPGGRAPATDKIGEVCAQGGMQAFPEPRDDAAAFARRETQSRVCPDGKLDAPAEHLAIAAGMCPVSPLGQR